MTRLAGETDFQMDMEEIRSYAKCLLVALTPSVLTTDFSVTANRGDALCILEEDEPDHNTTLGGRIIDPHEINIGLVEDWLSSCFKLHGTDCHPVWNEDLEGIRLVDIRTRKIVKYPTTKCDYLALSYVWGGVVQPSYQEGSVLEKGMVPQTIEDAITLADKLGKQYLWTDSLCIDQKDDMDKEEQIGKMWSIYRGSYATIIALSGTSANSGLPRLGPNGHMHSQVRCSIDGTRLVGLMPTLTQQIWVSPWGSRAWTLQEASLSPRCLYVSDHQLYFECNAMQCCESLNQTNSWAHNLRRDSFPAREGWLAAQLGAGCLRNPVDEPSLQLLHYGAKLALYSYRSMTNDVDGLNALSGILQHLKIWYYHEGFHYGLPKEDFQWGLLWRSQSPLKRRAGFPTWSWAGWKGAIWPAYPFDISKPQKTAIYLQIWKSLGTKLGQVFNVDGEMAAEDTENFNIYSRNDPIMKASQLAPQDPHFDLKLYPRAQDDGYLFIEAIMLQFIPRFNNPVYSIQERGEDEVFRVKILEVVCGIKIISTDEEIYKDAGESNENFVLLARDCSQGFVFHHLMWVRLAGNIATRITVLQLMVPDDKLEVLEALQPRKRKAVLT